MIHILEDCDKSCTSCNKDEKLDCMLEMREVLHDLVKSHKDAILSFVQMLNGRVSRPEKDEKVGII